MRIDSPKVLGALTLEPGSEAILTGSFTGSFVGELTGLVDGINISDLQTQVNSLDTSVGGDIQGEQTARILGDLNNQNELTAHKADSTNPHSVTKAQVGLGNVDNTSDLSKPISTATQAALDLKSDGGDLTTLEGRVTDVEGDVAAILLSADADKDSFAEIVTLINSVDTTNDSAFASHATDTDNPHSVTKAQVGLGNADNTSDADKPVSTAQQAALDLKADIATLDSTYATDAQVASAVSALSGSASADRTAIKATLSALDSTYATDAQVASAVSALSSSAAAKSAINAANIATNTSAIAALDSTYATDAQVASAVSALSSSAAAKQAINAADIATINAKDPVLTVSGDASGTATFTNLGNASMTLTIADDSHNHVISNVDGLQAALDLKAPLASPALTGNPTAPTQTGTDESTKIATTAFVQGRIDAIIGTAGSTLDTLGELSASMAADESGLAALTTTVGTKLAKSSNLSDLTSASTARTNLGLGSLATLSTVNAATITDNSVGAAELNVSGNGTTAQFLRSDGDGTFTWATPTDTNTTYTAGTGLGLSGTTFSHSDTSTQASVNNSGRTYIQDITLDGFGHVTGIASATETVVNTDTNTTYSAGTGITLTGTTFSIGQAVGTANNVQFNSLGIGTAAPGTAGLIRATNDVVAYYSSDRRLKDNIQPIEDALGKVEAMGGYSFDWNDKQEVYEGHDVGVIAQEVQAVLPELVETRDSGFLAVKYEKLTAVLIEAVKELSARVKELESK